MKYITNSFLKLKTKSANWSLKSIERRNFKNPELFSIILSDGVIFDFLIQKNYPKNSEYFKNILLESYFWLTLFYYFFKHKNVL
jgi:hypothetical protein